MINMEIVEKECTKCHNIRKFLKDTPRDIEGICGNCWDWEKDPQYIALTSDEVLKLRQLLGA